MPTRRSISMARARARLRGSRWCTIAASAIWSPTVNTGLSDVIAADGAQLGGAERQQVPPLEFDQAAREDVPRRLRDEAQDRERRHGLAAPRLPDDAEGLAGMDVEGHAVDRARRAAAALGDEIRLEIAHPQQGLRHAVSRPGSRASRSASPTAVSAITTTAMASPGNSEVHGAVAS